MALPDAEALAAYDKLAREFMAKVDRGEAKSTRTYEEFRRILNREVK